MKTGKNFTIIISTKKQHEAQKQQQKVSKHEETPMNVMRILLEHSVTRESNKKTKYSHAHTQVTTQEIQCDTRHFSRYRALLRLAIESQC